MRCTVRLSKYEIWLGPRYNLFARTDTMAIGDEYNLVHYRYLKKWFRNWLEECNINWDWDSTYGVLYVYREEDAVLIMTTWG